MEGCNLQESCLSRGIKHCGYHVCVLGTIGAGKSTLASALQSAIEFSEGKCQAFYEPVSSNPILPLFYTDKARYALSMQIYMLNKRLEQQRVIQDLALSGTSCVQDSSLFGDTCFVEMLYKDGIMGEEEVMVYSELFANMTRDVMYPTMVVYLNCPPEVALQRIKKRGRNFETDISAEYVDKLNKEIKVLCDEFKRYTFVKEIDASADLTDAQIKEEAFAIYSELAKTRSNPILNRMGV